MRTVADVLMAVAGPGAVLDEDGVIVAWNTAASELLGFTAADACGRDVPGLLFPEELRRAYGGGLGPFTGPSIRGGPAGRWPAPLVGRDGSVQVIDLVIEPVELGGRSHYRLAFERQRVSPAVAEAALPLPFLERIFEHAPEVITVIERDGRQRTVNPQGLGLLGFSPPAGPLDGILVVHPDDVPLLADLNRATVDDAGRPRSTRYRVRDGVGAWRWVESVAADLNDDPVIQGSIVFTRDVTQDAERAQALEVAEARLRAAISNVSFAALLEDPSGRGALWNDGFADLMGDGAAEGLAAGFDAVEGLQAIARRATDPDAAALVLAHLGAADGLETVELVDGRTLEVEAVGVRHDDELLGRFWLLRDVTDRVAMVKQREELLGLEQAARRLAEEQADRMRDFDRLRGDFVATVSHELRTPLTSVISATDYLLTCTPDEQAQDLPRFLELIQRNARRLSRLVDDLLVVSRLDTGMLSLEQRPVDVVMLVAAAVEDLGPVAAERGVTLRFRSTAGPPLAGDALRLQQVVENLLTNAIKFTEAGTAVDVRCTHDGGRWTIAVRDYGPGIAPDERELVFDRFYRSPATVAAGTKGSGLGLTIARGLVELHGGTLTACTPVGGGAELVCVLPERPSAVR